MAYNLIDERWIPVERRSGKVEVIAPADIGDQKDPPLRIASPRPDFDGALLEFLVGLLQTAAAPGTERAWRKEWDEPPAAALLSKRFKAVREAFFLDGDGPRFMQDLTVAKDPKANELPVGALLIDRIGETGLGESPSLFAKPGRFEALGYPATAAALMAMQTYAPSGGRGHLTSLRGGGPLTTLVQGSTLWETAWLNVLPRSVFEEVVPGDAAKEGPGAVFPWMAPTRTSGAKGGQPTPPKAVHPLQHLWGLPRRFRLVIDLNATGDCDVSGASGPVVRAFVSRPDGTSYDGDYRHPWTPYTLSKPGEPWNPKKGSADGLPYRDWPLLVTGTEQRAPAAVVSHFVRSRGELVDAPRLLAFGYAMDNMKPLRWCRSETPLIAIAAHLANDFAGEAEAFVAVSEEVRRTLSGQIRAAWSDRPANLDVFERVNPAFWSRTEGDFFAAITAAKVALEQGRTGLDLAREAWLAALHRAALELFQSFVEPSADLAAPDLRRALQAERALALFTHPSSSKLRKLLHLTVEDAPAAKKPRRGAKKENA